MTTPRTGHAGAILTIDLDAVAANWRSLAARLGAAECGAVVKADGYGLGVEAVGQTLFAAGCRRFFVASIDEGIALRAVLGGADIYVLNGLMAADTPGVLDAHGLVPVLNSPGDVDAWSAHGRAHGGRRAILALDTGMSRLGLEPAEVGAIAARGDALAGLSLDFVMSHLACAEDPASPLNARQKDLFDGLRAALPAAPASLANSGGIFLGPDYHYDLARPGAALYGVSRDVNAPQPMRQVIHLKGRILQVRVVDSAGTVGYGATHRVPKGTRLATVAVGYADGYLRSLSNRGSGFVGNVRVPLVGRVSMDLVTFDVSAVTGREVRAGDWVDLISEQHTVDDLAAEANTIGYVILTALGRRYHREYTGGPEA